MPLFFRIGKKSVFSHCSSYDCFRIYRIDGHGNILVSLKVHEDKMKTEDDTGISHVPSHSLKIGDIRTAV